MSRQDAAPFGVAAGLTKYSLGDKPRECGDRTLRNDILAIYARHVSMTSRTIQGDDADVSGQVLP